MSHDYQGKVGACGRSVLVSSLVLRRQSTCAVSIPVQQDQDRQDGRMEVIADPTTASPPEAFAGEDYFCQDSLYKLSPFEFGRCGIPSRLHLGEDQGHYK